MPDVPTTGLTDQVIQGSTVHSNVAQEFIVTTRDKLELCLNHHKEKVEARQQWPVPFGIFITVLLTLLTADFKEKALGIPKDIWFTIFLMVGALSAVWLVYSLLKAAISYFTAWWKGEPLGIEAIIKEITKPIDSPKSANPTAVNPEANP
jgi:hypothetical protein